MALTRPTFQNIDSNLAFIRDGLTVQNYGNVANRDIGFIFDRNSQGSQSNVGLIWNESTQGFRVVYTSSTGAENGNIAITANANLTVGNLIATTLTVTNISYINQETITSTDVIQGNITANGITVNTSVTVGTTLGVTGNITGNYFIGNGALLSGIASSSTYGNTNVAAYLPTYSGSLGGTLTTNAQPNITSTGTLTGLTLSGTLTGTTINAGTFGNNGANFVGTVFSASGSFAGPLTGTLGATGAANTAIVSTLTATGTATVNALVSNGAIQGTTIGGSGTATFASVVSNGAIQGTTIGGSGTATVNTLVSNGAIQGTTIGGSGTATFASVVSNGAIQGTTVGASGNATVSALTVNNSATIGSSLGVIGNITGGNLSVTGTASVSSLTISGGLQNTPVGNATPNTGNFTTLQSSGTATVNALVSNGAIQGTTIGGSGIATFASVVSNGAIQATTIGGSGNATVAALTVNGSATIGTTLGVAGNIIAGNITIPGSANISTFIGNAFFGSVPAQPTWYTVAPLNLNNNLAAATKVQLNLINTGGGAGAGSAIDFYTYQISVAAANAESRIAAIDDGNYSAYLSLQTKTPGSTGTNGLVERVKIDSTGVLVVANITGGNLLTGGVISSAGNAIVSALTVNNSATIGTTLGVAGVTRITDSTQGGSGAGALVVTGGGSFGKDLYVTGNLYAANLIAINTSNLSVQDPLLYLTANSVYPYNYSIGFYSQYQGGNPGNVSANTYQHTGFVRDSSDLTWKLFSNVIPEPGVTVDFTNAQYDQLKAGNTTVVGTLSTSGNLTVGGVTNFGNNLLVGNNAVFVGNSTVGGLTIGTGTQFGLSNNSYGVIWPASVTPSNFNYSVLIGSADVQFNATRVTLQGGGTSNFRVTTGSGSYTSATAQGTQVLQNGLGVQGDSYFAGNLGVGGNLTVTGTTTFTGNILGNTTHSANVIAAGFFFANGAAVGTGGGSTGITYTANTAPPTSGNIKGDQWYNTSTDVLYEYQFDGTSNYWIDVTSSALAANTFSTSGNLTITGNIIPNSNVAYDLGSPSIRFRSLYLSGNTIDLGGASIKTDSVSGAIALIPQPTAANPNPNAAVISSSGAITTVATTGGNINQTAFTNAANAAASGGGNVTIGNLTIGTGIFYSNGTAFSSGVSNARLTGYNLVFGG